MHPAPTTPLGQAFAAIIHLLIAAIAEYAREHPLLAAGCRASIRQLETLAARFDAMVQDWHAAQTPPSSPPPRPAPGPKPAVHIQPEPRRDAPSRRRCVPMYDRLPAARAPPALRVLARILPEPPPALRRMGAARTYAPH